MAKTLLLIHGHGPKPPEEPLAAIWIEALRCGLQRDCPEHLASFDAADKRLIYFGDLNNTVHAATNSGYDPVLDIADRKNALTRLVELRKPKKFNRYNYEQLPGKSAIPELVADLGAPLLGKLGVAPRVISRVLPELAAYWDSSSDYYRQSSGRAHAVLREQLSSGHSIALIAHGIGAVIAYDALWHLSHAAAAPEVACNAKIDRFLTLGAPLGDNTVRQQLAGSGEAPAERYPRNVLNWYNVAAEDDYLCHDKTLRDDFEAMLKQRLVSLIDDFRIYNLSMRYGRSNPHSSVGYLVHPRVTRLLSDWLLSDTPAADAAGGGADR